MAAPKVLCDTGPLVAFLVQSDEHHEWTCEQFTRIPKPMFTCEAVISEAAFLLQSERIPVEALMSFIDRHALEVQFSAPEHWPDLRRLLKKYAELPMSFADACLVRMAELAGHFRVLTTDRHFQLYRRHGRDVIPLLAPF
ncbi:MAG: PIN domain-containing protein [Verrucomicrobia bacterium]|nr:PIN domain-containing protein [Verrucomicrobiota bacterium]